MKSEWMSDASTKLVATGLARGTWYPGVMSCGEMPAMVPIQPLHKQGTWCTCTHRAGDFPSN